MYTFSVDVVAMRRASVFSLYTSYGVQPEISNSKLGAGGEESKVKRNALEPQRRGSDPPPAIAMCATGSVNGPRGGAAATKPKSPIV